MEFVSTFWVKCQLNNSLKQSIVSLYASVLYLFLFFYFIFISLYTTALKIKTDLLYFIIVCLMYFTFVYLDILNALIIAVHGGHIDLNTRECNFFYHLLSLLPTQTI